MFSFAVGQQHVARPTRSSRDTLRHQAITCRWHVGPADGYVLAAQERRREVGEPLGIGPGIIVEIGDDLA